MIPIVNDSLNTEIENKLIGDKVKKNLLLYGLKKFNWFVYLVINRQADSMYINSLIVKKRGFTVRRFVKHVRIQDKNNNENN